MPKEEADLLLTDSQRVQKKGSGVGLVNVKNRIQILFGKAYGLVIESEPDEALPSLFTFRQYHIQKKTGQYWNRAGLFLRRKKMRIRQRIGKMKNSKKMFILIEAALAMAVIILAVIMFLGNNVNDRERVSVIVQNSDDSSGRRLNMALRWRQKTRKLKCLLWALKGRCLRKMRKMSLSRRLITERMHLLYSRQQGRYGGDVKGYFPENPCTSRRI